jgi:kynureninase
MYQATDDSLKSAQSMDQQDPLKDFRKEFHFPTNSSGKEMLYFTGHSLGLMPKKTPEAIQVELDSWSKYGVEGHFHGPHPWLPYHENITASFARLVGAKESEVVAMNTLTVNLHLMLVSFYRPTKNKYKIMIEANTFPSDKYAVDSQARFHGHDPAKAIIELKTDSEKVTSAEYLLEQIRENKDELNLIMLGNCNYLSGQCFDMQKIVECAHQHGIMVGFNLAHGAGNLKMQLHQWNVDFAVWCSYKYLNSGPGGIAGAFVHEKHLGDPKIPRFEGWWGHDKSTRFQMGPDFRPIPTAEAWQLSNPPIFQLASLMSSMDIFDRAGMDRIHEKQIKLTNYLRFLLNKNGEGFLTVETPADSGAMLCLSFDKNPKQLMQAMMDNHILVDFREPNIIRMAPAPLYNSFEDVYSLVQIIKEFAHE